MKKSAAQQARRVLDGNLVGFGKGLQTPRDGWIRSIRDALGMTRQQLGSRMASTRFAKNGISASAVQAMERQESQGKITLDSLERAACAMDCHLVYALVPNSSLQETVENRAERVAADTAERVGRTMALEAQREGVSAKLIEPQSLIDSPLLWRQ